MISLSNRKKKIRDKRESSTGKLMWFLPVPNYISASKLYSQVLRENVYQVRRRLSGRVQVR